MDTVQSSVYERFRAIEAAAKDWQRARLIAREIALPWYRAQALANVAFRAPDSDRNDVFKEAWKTVWSCDEPYKRVAVAAWPARAQIERSGDFPGRMMHKLLYQSQMIENSGSKVEALLLLWNGLHPLGRDRIAPVQDALIESGLRSISWRGVACLRELALMIPPKEGLAIAEQMPECRVRRQLFREIGEGKRFRVRTFFIVEHEE